MGNGRRLPLHHREPDAQAHGAWAGLPVGEARLYLNALALPPHDLGLDCRSVVDRELRLRIEQGLSTLLARAADRDEAELQLREKNLNPIVVTVEVDDQNQIGNVISQAPEAGSVVPIGTEVTIHVGVARQQPPDTGGDGDGDGGG